MLRNRLVSSADFVLTRCVFLSECLKNVAQSTRVRLSGQMNPVLDKIFKAQSLSCFLLSLLMKDLCVP